MESLQSHCIHTQFHWSSGPPVCFPSLGTRVQSPGGVLKWNRDSPVSVVSLHWWPRRDWSLWPCPRQASFRTVTRPSCRQCDNPTWSRTALLSRLHARCRSSFRIHNRRSRHAGEEACGETAISLHSYTVPLVQWSTRLLSIMRDLGSTPRRVLMWNRDSSVSVVSPQGTSCC